MKAQCPQAACGIAQLLCKTIVHPCQIQADFVFLPCMLFVVSEFKTYSALFL